MDGSRETIDILGIGVDRVDMEAALGRFEAMLAGPGTALIATPNAEIVQRASSRKQLRALLAEADLLLPDGAGLLLASRLLGRPLKERVTGIDFAQKALERMAREGGGVYFLGGRPGVAQAAADRQKAAMPGLVVQGCHHGYFSREEIPDLLAEIRRSGACLLLVALGFPGQERFMVEHRASLGVKVAVGVGGSFDVWAGQLKRAPAFYREKGLEWLYRLIQEPARLKRAGALPLFVIKVAGQRLGLYRPGARQERRQEKEKI